MMFMSYVQWWKGSGLNWAGNNIDFENAACNIKFEWSDAR